MSQTKTTTAKKPTKQQAQAMREQEIRSEGHVRGWELGYQYGLDIGRNSGWFAGYEVGEKKGIETERRCWTQRPFLQRLRYLINPNHTI